MNSLSRFIATGIYTGYAPVAPGTAGSILGLFLYWATPGSETLAFLLVIISFFVLGALSASHTEATTGVQDNQVIVIDEIVGVWITLVACPKTWWALALGLLLFRIFDILKPPPVRQAERFPRGWGVMMDDVVAGIYAFIVLRATLFFVG